MSVCVGCGSNRMVGVNAKCSDLCVVTLINGDHRPDPDYVPEDMGIGGGDNVDFDYCLDCGKIEGTWPLPPCELEDGGENEDEI